MKDCNHARYTMQELDQTWLSHSAVQVQVRRVCLDCGKTSVDWEWGDDAQAPRMIQDETNFFTGEGKAVVEVI